MMRRGRSGNVRKKSEINAKTLKIFRQCQKTTWSDAHNLTLNRAARRGKKLPNRKRRKMI
jgi:hypothetical protein